MTDQKCIQSIDICTHESPLSVKHENATQYAVSSAQSDALGFDRRLLPTRYVTGTRLTHGIEESDFFPAWNPANHCALIKDILVIHSLWSVLPD